MTCYRTACRLGINHPPTSGLQNVPGESVSLELFANAPWWLLTLVGGLGIFLLFVGNLRHNKRILLAGLGVLAIALVLTAVSMINETPAERIRKHIQQIAVSLNMRDWEALVQHMDPGLTFGSYGNRDAIKLGAQATAENIGLQNVRILSSEIRKQGNFYVSDLAVMSSQELTLGRPIRTNWRLTWEPLDNDWLMTRIEVLPSDMISPESIQRSLR